MSTRAVPVPLSRAQRIVLRAIADSPVFPGYGSLMSAAGLSTLRGVDWVMEALNRRGYIKPVSERYEITGIGRRDSHEVTELGREALAELAETA